MKLEITAEMLVAPRSIHSSAHMAITRHSVLHVINPETARCFCGRDPDTWDIPYFGSTDDVPTMTEIVEDCGNSYCLSCRRALRRKHVGELES